MKSCKKLLKKNVFYFLFLISYFLLPISSVTAEDFTNISADHLEYLSQSKTFIAKGSVKIVFEDSTLLADEMRLNSNTSDTIATGNVVYEDPDAIIRADKIELNLKTKLGTIYNSYVFYKKLNFHLYGGDLRKTGKKTISLDKATVTTCDADPPQWHISGKDIKATQHKNLSARNASFYVKKIPVLYTPYFWAPLLEERQTGFLFPSFGYSSTRGYYYKQGFFWAIKDNQDATIYLDYYSKKGMAQGLDYRYIITPESNGETWIYHARDRQPYRDLFEIKSYHNQKLPYDISGYLKLHAVNEFDYYETMDSTSLNRFGLESRKSNPLGFASEERLQKYLESNLQLSKPFLGGRVYLLSQGRQSLEGSSSEIPQSLPEIGYILNTVSKGPFSFNIFAKGINFWREKGQEGLRFDINPNVYLSFGRMINLTQRFGLRDTAYFLNTPDFNKNRFLFDLNTALTTRFFRKYNTFIHVVEPSLEYSYIPSADDDNIPFFDSIDSISHTSSIAYSLTNRISGFASHNLETRFRLSQSYSLLDVEKKFSPLLAEATLSSDKLDFAINASFDVHDSRFTETIGSFHVRGEKAYVGIGKNFRHSSSLDQVTLDAGINRPIKLYKTLLPIDLHGKLWYDLNNGRVQELNLKSTYLHQCWGFSIAYNRLPNEYQIIFAVELRGLGTVSLGSI